MEKRRIQAESLNSDVITEILTRLPPKSLLRLKCVCKSWRSIIDDPLFIDLQTRLCKKKLLTMQYASSPRWMFNMIDLNSFISEELDLSRVPRLIRRVIDHLNGVLLLLRGRTNLVLWNPSIKKALVIPPCPIGDYTRYCGFDPFDYNDLNIRYFLGYDPSSYDYKVLGLSTVVLEHGIQVAIYAPRTNSWKIKEVEFKHTWFYDYRRVFAQGALHWIGCNQFRPSTEGEVACISFDFGVEEFSSTCWRCEKSSVWFPFRHGESLAIFEISRVHSCAWIRNEGDWEELWRRWYAVAPQLNNHFLFSSIKGLIYLENCGKLLFVDDRDVKTYDIVNGEMEVIFEIPSCMKDHTDKRARRSFSLDYARNYRPIGPIGNTVCYYVESLVLNKDLKAIDQDIHRQHRML